MNVLPSAKVSRRRLQSPPFSISATGFHLSARENDDLRYRTCLFCSSPGTSCSLHSVAFLLNIFIFYSLVPAFILRPPHQSLAVVSSCGAPAKDIGWGRKLARISCNSKRIELGDELLIKVSPHRQRPAAALDEGLSRNGNAGMEPASGVLLLNFASVITQDFRWLGPDIVRYRDCEVAL